MSLPPPLRSLPPTPHAAPRTEPRGLLLTALICGVVALGLSLVVLWRDGLDFLPGFAISIGIGAACVMAFLAIVLGAIGIGTSEDSRPLAILGVAAGLISGGVLLWSGVTHVIRTAPELVEKIQTEQSDQADLKAADQPIETELSAQTFAEARLELHAFLERRLLARYDSGAMSGQPWSGAARHLVLEAAHAWVDTPGHAARSDQARKIISTGCNDPLVFAIGSTAASDHQRGMEYADRAVQLLEATGEKSPFVRYIVHLARYREMEDQRMPGDQVATSLPAGFEAVAASLVDLSKEDAKVWHELLLRMPESLDLLAERPQEALAMFKNATPLESWQRKRLLGCIEAALAWRVWNPERDAKDYVERAKLFEEHLKRARTVLEASWQENPLHPGAAADLIRVVASSEDSQSKNAMRMWFDRAVQAQADYPPAYKHLRETLSWTESDEALQRLGSRCLETRRFDTEIPWQLLLIHKDLASYSDTPEWYWRKEGLYESLQPVLDGYLSEPSKAHLRNYYFSTYAILADKCGKKEDSARLLAQAGGNLDLNAAVEWDIFEVEIWTRRVRDKM